MNADDRRDQPPRKRDAVRPALLSRRSRERLLVCAAGAALLAGAPELARGQTSPPAKTAAPPPDDGLGARDTYMEADQVLDDYGRKFVTATGHVIMRREGRTLRADKVTYDQVKGVARAEGDVVIQNADGTQEYAKTIVLDDDFRAAVATGFSARLPDNVTLVSGAAIRRDATTTELNEGLYTPCNICQPDGVTPKNPTWSIQATRIVEDRLHHIIYYRNAVIRILGRPVFYAPIFWHADPFTERQSGLLSPRITYASNRGLSYTQPYYLDISPSAGLTITPQINTRVDPFVSLRFREQFYSGDVDIRVGYTYSEEFDPHRFFGGDTSRSFILGRGSFQVSPDWKVGFGLERVTDATLFQRYTIPQVYVDRGPYPTDTDRLISQVYAQRQNQSSYLSVAALSFQSLRAAVLDDGVQTGIQSFDTSAAFPTATPVEGRLDPQINVLGGRLRLSGDAVTLTRSNEVVSVEDPLGLQVQGPQLYSYKGQTQIPVQDTTPTPADPINSLFYRDSRSLDGEANWQGNLTFTSGIRIQPFADARLDYFSTDDATLETLTGVSAATSKAEESIGRGLGSVGATVSWPFVKPVWGGSFILEPVAQLIYANRLRYNPNIPNEDSVSLEFDETNLFELNRFSGYDLMESGPRANVGVRGDLDLPDGRAASFTLGKVWRADPDTAFTPQSGLRGTDSDWITAVSVTPIKGFTLFNRARFGESDWTVHREEAGVNFGFGRLFASLRFVYEQSGTVQVDCTGGQLTLSASGVSECPSPFGGALVPAGSSVIGAVENMDIHGSWFFTKHWGVTVNATRDFVGFENNGVYKPVWPLTQVGLTYQDECIRVDVIYSHDEYYSATIGPSNSIAVRLTLTTLGGTLGTPAGSSQGAR